MALSIDILKANQVLASLTNDQLTAIVELSTNDEATVIGQKIGALHGQYDADVKALTGLDKNQGEKSYDYVKRVLGAYKEDVTKLQTEKTDLEAKVASSSGDAALKQKLADVEKRLTDAQALIDTNKTSLEAKTKEYEDALRNVHVDYAFAQATSGLKFKAGIPESVQSVLVNNAKTEILTKSKPEFIEVNGTKSLVFRDANGNVMNNPENKLNPFTAKELILTTSLKDVLDFGKQQSGAGTNNLKTGGSTTLDFTGVKNQVEADDMIGQHLLSVGLTRGSAEFAAKQMEIRNENNVSSLPIR